MTRQRLREIAHDLRSPLVRINLALALVRSGEDVAEALEVLERESARLSAMVEALGAEEDTPAADLDLDGLLRSVAEDCEIEAKAKGCGLDLTLGATTVRGDAEGLRRAFENVLRNALRFAPKGSRVAVKSADSENSCVVEIRDLGPGVPSEALPKIFDPYFRLNDGDGQGLGLAIAERVVKSNGGEIHAENASPGLCVTITLPQSNAEMR
jgi:signal transduction histidine kinase